MNVLESQTGATCHVYKKRRPKHETEIESISTGWINRTTYEMVNIHIVTADDERIVLYMTKERAKEIAKSLLEYSK